MSEGSSQETTELPQVKPPKRKSGNFFSIFSSRFATPNSKVVKSAEQIGFSEPEVEEAFGEFVYRGEGSSSHGANSIKIVDLLDIFSKQGGIGGSKSTIGVPRGGDKPSTFVSPDPRKALEYTKLINPETGRMPLDEARGIWLLRKPVLSIAIPRSQTLSSDIIRRVERVIPFEYVEKLLVTERVREQIFQKYGAENTELFGRPIKDVVISGLNNLDLGEERNKSVQKILELNLAERSSHETTELPQAELKRV